MSCSLTLCALRIVENTIFASTFTALIPFLRVYLLIPRDFEIFLRLSPLACLLFTSSIFSSVNIIYRYVFFYIFSFPCPVNFHKHVMSKICYNWRCVQNNWVGEQEYVPTLRLPLFFRNLTLYTLKQHDRQQRQVGCFFIRHNSTYNAGFLSVYNLLELSTQYWQYSLRHLLEILQF